MRQAQQSKVITTPGQRSVLCKRTITKCLQYVCNVSPMISGDRVHFMKNSAIKIHELEPGTFLNIVYMIQLRIQTSNSASEARVAPVCRQPAASRC